MTLQYGHQGQLRLLAEVGRDARAVLYQAARGEQLLTVKVLTSPVADVPEERVRLRREAGLLARLRHPGMPKVLGVDELDGRPCLVMEHVAGERLSERLARGALSEQEVVRLAEALTGSLQELHSHGILHRNLNPGNVLIDQDDHVWLVGFDSVSGWAGESSLWEALLYGAPELIGELRRPIDGRADLYALGAVLFEAATGRPPFQAPTRDELIRLHASLIPPDVCRLNPTISPALGAIIARLLAKEPADRYQTGAGLLFDLKRLDELNQAYRGDAPVVLGMDDRLASASEMRLRGHLEALLHVSMVSQASALHPRMALDAMIRTLGAERALLLESADGTAAPQPTLGRSADGADLADLQTYRPTVVKQAWESRAPVFFMGGGTDQTPPRDEPYMVMAAPLLVRDRLLGVVYVECSVAKGTFFEEDVQVATALSSHIATALETARLAHLQAEVESERRQRRLADGLRDLTHALSAAMTQEEVVERFMVALPQITPHDCAAVLYGKESILQVLAAVGFGAMDPLVGQTVVLTADEQLYSIVRSGEALVVPITHEGAPFPWRGPIRSWVAAPLMSNREVVGLLVLGSRTANTFDPYEMGVVETAAASAGMALEKARLFDEVRRRAITDDLTQAYNRRHLMDIASRELSRAVRKGFPLSVIMLDVDHFKTFNDTYGHFVGDEVLRAVVQRSTRSLREADVLGRYGGEEFAVVLPDTTAEGASKVAERLQKAISGEPILTRRGPLSVTVSMGIAAVRSQDENLANLFNRADDALYAAKSAGRNRVVVSD